MSKKIPDKEVSFVKDQREKIGLKGGMMVMESSIDRRDTEEVVEAIKQTEKAEEREKRAREVSERVKRNVKERRESERVKVVDQLDEIPELTKDDSRDESYEGSRVKVTKQTRLTLQHFSAEVRRYFVGERAAAALWNAVIKDLEDANVLKEEYNEENMIEKLIVDRYKCRRELTRFGEIAKNEKDEKIKHEEGLACIGTDGKKDRKTKIVEEVEVNNETVTKYSQGTEDHISYTQEPGGEYLTHSAVDDGTGKGCAKDFLEVVAESGSESTLRAVLCDGCKVNTGWKSGLFVSVERALECQLLCLSCMLHANELYFRALFTNCDGGFGTTGKTSTLYIFIC